MLQAMMEMQSGESAYERQRRKGRGGKEDGHLGVAEVLLIIANLHL